MVEMRNIKFCLIALYAESIGNGVLCPIIVAVVIIFSFSKLRFLSLLFRLTSFFEMPSAFANLKKSGTAPRTGMLYLSERDFSSLIVTLVSNRIIYISTVIIPKPKAKRIVNFSTLGKLCATGSLGWLKMVTEPEPTIFSSDLDAISEYTSAIFNESSGD